MERGSREGTGGGVVNGDEEGMTAEDVTKTDNGTMRTRAQVLEEIVPFPARLAAIPPRGEEPASHNRYLRILRDHLSIQSPLHGARCDGMHFFFQKTRRWSSLIHSFKEKERLVKPLQTDALRICSSLYAGLDDRKATNSTASKDFLSCIM